MLTHKLWNLSLKMDCWWLARLNNRLSRAWSCPRPPSQQVSQILWHLEHYIFARISISDPPQAGQAGWHCFSLFFIFVSEMIPLRSFSCWNFMGLDLYFDDRSMERLTSIQLPSSTGCSFAKTGGFGLAFSIPTGVALANGSFERTIFSEGDTECEYFSPAALAKLDAMLLLT